MASLETRIKSFWKRVKKMPNGCFHWLGGGTRYGQIRWKDRHIPVTHFVWFITYNKWPKNQMNHKCHNPICVNPEHLYDGTQLENMQDMKNAGRRKQPNQNGEKNPRAKLTKCQVKKIRKLHGTGKYTLTALAKDYHVSITNIWYIVNHKTW